MERLANQKSRGVGELIAAMVMPLSAALAGCLYLAFPSIVPLLTPLVAFFLLLISPFAIFYSVMGATGEGGKLHRTRCSILATLNIGLAFLSLTLFVLCLNELKQANREIDQLDGIEQTTVSR